MKYIFISSLGGAIGGAVVDLIYITYAGPSGLFTLMGITQRMDVFYAHMVLGAALGILFALIAKKSRLNIWLVGFLYSMAVMILVGGLPSLYLGFVSPIATIYGFVVWTLFGFILSGAYLLKSHIEIK